MAFNPTPNPARCAMAIDVSTADWTASEPTRAIYVGVTGDIKVDMDQIGTVTFADVPQGVTLPVAVSKVYSSGTAASGLVVLW